MDTLIKAIQKKNYEIINPSVKGLHAEVQIVIHTILNNHTQESYIGISKLGVSVKNKFRSLMSTGKLVTYLRYRINPQDIHSILAF